VFCNNVTLPPKQLFSLSNSEQIAVGLLVILLTDWDQENGKAGLDPRSLRTPTTGNFTYEEAMNGYRLNGKWMRFKGNLKQQWGKFINDDVRQIEGSLDKVIGQLQERDGGTCGSVVGEPDSEKKNELLRAAQPIAYAVDAKAVRESYQ
jgi:uncharacterized protein YjbJ (UPF0337 family)